MHIAMAFRAFFKVLLDNEFASAVKQQLDGTTGDAPATEAKPRLEPQPHKDKPQAASRSEALTLVAALQREARFVDMIKEPLDNYSDAQVGAAARDVLRDCGQVLDRLFAIQALVEQEEGAEVEVPAGYDANRYRLTGNVSGTPPFSGRLVHHGWIAQKCELPSWSGGVQSRMIVAPEEIDVK